MTEITLAALLSERSSPKRINETSVHTTILMPLSGKQANAFSSMLFVKKTVPPQLRPGDIDLVI
jgi:hypothetical protein